MKNFNASIVALFLVLTPFLSIGQVATLIDAENQNIINVNYLSLNDPGVGEGIRFNGTYSGWTIDVSPEDRSSSDGNLNFYGTAGKIVNWRPVLLKGTASSLQVQGLSSSYFMGKLGVGTDNPQQLFSVSAPEDPVLRLASSNSGNFDWELYSKLGGGLYFRGGADGVGKDLMDYFMINAQGNIGIGTVTPGAKLEVEHTGTLGGQWNPAQAYLKIEGNGSSMIMDSNEIYTDNSLVFGTSYSYDFEFRNVNGTEHENLMIIKADGNVGIGTVAPGSKLAVNGKITAKEVEVKANGWADFVFNDGYDLPTLSEVEKHVKANKHLPGIPSAKEVKKDGVNLGEMDALLLQKIEELTLYIIQQNKRIEELEKMVHQQDRGSCSSTIR